MPLDIRAPVSISRSPGLRVGFAAPGPESWMEPDRCPIGVGPDICENHHMTMPSQGIKPAIAPPTLWICEHCDTVYQRRKLCRGEVARCVRCDAILARHHSLSISGMLALVITAMIAFVQANVWP